MLSNDQGQTFERLILPKPLFVTETCHDHNQSVQKKPGAKDQSLTVVRFSKA